MKETYFKLNRDISWNIHEEVMVDHLISQNILEEVQEEEVKTSAEQAIDNMFGNPLEQVDDMIEGTKPFLDGMKPSVWIYAMQSDIEGENVIKHIATIEHVIDLLVEELKKNNVIK